MMTRKERFLTAVKAKQPDRVPMFDFLFQEPMYEALIGHRPGAYNAEDAVALALALDHDGVWLPFGGYNGFQPRYIAENTYIDEWGTTYQHNDSAWPIDAPSTTPSSRTTISSGACHPIRRCRAARRCWKNSASSTTTISPCAPASPARSRRPGC